MSSTLSLTKLRKKSRESQKNCETKKASKSAPRFDGLTESELQRFSLPDYITPDLDIVFVGINPSLLSAHRNRYYAGVGNHFYKLLHHSGLTPRLFQPEDDYKLLELGIGLTNIVSRPTRSSSDLRTAEIKTGVELTIEKLEFYRPKIAVFNGKCIYRAFTDKTVEFAFGLQRETIGVTKVWVTPSTSARCANFPRMDDKLRFFGGLAKYLRHLNGEIGQETAIDIGEFRYDGRCRQFIPRTSKMWRRKEISKFLNGGRIANRDTIGEESFDGNVAIASSTEFVVHRFDCSNGDGIVGKCLDNRGNNWKRLDKVANVEKRFDNDENIGESLYKVANAGKSLDNDESDGKGLDKVANIGKGSNRGANNAKSLDNDESDGKGLNKVANIGKSSNKVANNGKSLDNDENIEESSNKVAIIGQSLDNDENIGESSDKVAIIGQSLDNDENIGGSLNKVANIGKGLDNDENIGTSLDKVADAEKSSDNNENIGRSLNKVANMGKSWDNDENIGKRSNKVANAEKSWDSDENIGKSLDKVANVGKGLDNNENIGKSLYKVANVGKGLDNNENIGKSLYKVANVGKGLDNNENIGKSLYKVANVGKGLDNNENIGASLDKVANVGKSLDNNENTSKHLDNDENSAKNSSNVKNTRSSKDNGNKRKTLHDHDKMVNFKSTANSSSNETKKSSNNNNNNNNNEKLEFVDLIKDRLRKRRENIEISCNLKLKRIKDVN